jgi:hypothetical protein
MVFPLQKIEKTKALRAPPWWPETETLKSNQGVKL